MTQPLPALRNNLNFTPHRQQDRVWYAVEDPTTGRYLRIGRQEYLAAIHFNGVRTANEVIDVARAIDSSFTLNETNLTKLVGWLVRFNFVAGNSASTSPRGESKPLSSKWVWDPFSARFPIIPGIYVEKVARALQFLTGVRAALVAIVIICIATVAVVANWQEFFSYSQTLFVAEGRMWWLVAWLLLKIVHELGHAVTALRVGSQIRSAGISLIFLAPIPFIDVSDLWSISNRWHRILCSAGGMLFEITVAAIAVLIAFATENDSVRYLACAIAVTGTFSTIAFNANPLVRFDGYFILADVLQRSNLWGDGQTATRELFKRLVNPFRETRAPISLGLASYGLGCTLYRFGMLLGLGITALIVWQEYGLLLIGWGCCAWFILPWLKARKAAMQEQLNRPGPQSKQSVLAKWTPAAIAGFVIAILFLPSPMQLSVPGIVTLRDPTVLRIESDGYLAAVYVHESETVEADTLIARFENPTLVEMVASKRVEVNGSTESISAMRARGELAELQAEQAKLVSLVDQLGQLERRLKQLEVRAPRSGTIMSSDLKNQIGKHFTAGAPLALLATPGDFEIKLSASQQDQADLRPFLGQEIRIVSATFRTIPCVVDKFDWRGSDQLDEPVLAATYGGPITVATENELGADTIKLPAPRFDVRLRIAADKQDELVPGQIAWARLPNSSTRVIDLIGHWVSKKWESAKQLHKSS